MTFHILIGKFSYFVIRFLNHIFFVINFSYFVIWFYYKAIKWKSDNEIGKVNDKKNLILKSDNDIGKFSYQDMECPMRTGPMLILGQNIAY